MSDLSAVSDADLLASLPVGARNNNPLNIKGPDGQFATYPTSQDGMAAADQNLAAYGTKHGINTIAGVTARWAPKGDGNNDPAAYANYIAQRTGIAPDQQVDLSDAATRQTILGPMSEFETGQQKTGRDLSRVSDADLLASIPGAQASAPAAQPAEREVGASHNRGVVISVGGAPAPAAPAAPQQPDMGQDIGKSLSGGLLRGPLGLLDQVAQPFIDPANRAGVLSNWLASLVTGKKPAPSLSIPSPTQAASVLPGVAQALDYKSKTVPGAYARTIGENALAAVAPAESIPARLANWLVPSLTSETAGQVANHFGASPLVEQIARSGGALAGGAAANMRFAPGVPASEAVASLADIKARSDAAWTALDKSTYKVPQSQVQGAADAMQTALNEAGPELYTDAPKLLARTQALAQRDDVTVAQLNKLRSQIGHKLLSPTSTEPDMGSAFKGAIDNVILNSGDPNVAPARDLYTRLQKMQAVTNAVGSADLTSNAAGAIPNKLRPFIDPKSPQRIRNLTPEEQAAIRQIAKGDLTSNLLLKPLGAARLNGPISGPIMGALAFPTKGASMGLGAAGVVAKSVQDARTMGQVQKLLDMMSLGGKAPVSSAPKVIGFDPLSDPAITSLLLSRPIPASAMR